MSMNAWEGMRPATPDAIIAGGADREGEQDVEAEVLGLAYFAPGEKGFAPSEVATDDYLRHAYGYASDKEIDFQYGTAAERQDEESRRAAREAVVGRLKVRDAEDGEERLSARLLERLRAMGPEDQEAYLRGYLDEDGAATAAYALRYLETRDEERPENRLALIPRLAPMMQGTIERSLEDADVHGATADLLVSIAEDLRIAGIDVLSGVEADGLGVSDAMDVEHDTVRKSDVRQRVAAFRKGQEDRLAA